MNRKLFERRKLFWWICIYCVSCLVITAVTTGIIIVLSKSNKPDTSAGIKATLVVPIIYWCIACFMGIFVILSLQRQSKRIKIGFLIYLGLILFFALVGPPIFKYFDVDEIHNQFLLFILGGLLLAFSILFKEYLDTTKNAPFLLTSIYDISKPQKAKVTDYQINIQSAEPDHEIILVLENKSNFAIVLRNYKSILSKDSDHKNCIQTHEFKHSIFMSPQSAINIGINFQYSESAKKPVGLYFFAETDCKYKFRYLLVFEELQSKKKDYFLDYEIV